MSEQNYWTRRYNRRAIFRGAAVGGVGLAGAALIGCGDDDDDDDGATATATATATAAPGTATAQPTAAPGEVDLDADLIVGSAAELPGGNLDFSSVAGGGGYGIRSDLFAKGRDNAITKGGFADFEWREDNNVLRVKLQQGIKFTNGAVLNAEGLKFSLDRGLGRLSSSPDFLGTYASRQQFIGEMTIVDELTLDIHMAEGPFRDAPENITEAGIVDMGYILDKGDQAQAEHPISVGPMKFESFDPDQDIRTVRNDDYFFPSDINGLTWASGSAAQVKRVILKGIPEVQARVAALEAGEIDIAEGISPDLAKQLEGRESFKVILLPNLRTLEIEIPFNWATDPITGGPNPWRDKRVRQAANYALDLDSIIRNLLTGAEEKGYPPFPRGGFPLPLGDLEAPYSYDPARARALLEEAGAVGFEFTLLIAQLGSWGEVGQWGPAMQQMFNDVGFKASIRILPFRAGLDAAIEKTHDGPWVYQMGANSSGSTFKNPDSQWGSIITTGGKYSHNVRPDHGSGWAARMDPLPEFIEFEQTLAEARSLWESEDRDPLFFRAAEIVYENALNIPLWNIQNLHATRGNILYTQYQDIPAGLETERVQVLRT